MRKALVFVAAFALVLVAGAALAFMAAPGPDDDVSSSPVEESSTTLSTAAEEKTVSTEVKSEAQPVKEQTETPTEKTQPEGADEAEPLEEKDTTPPDLVILHPKEGQHFAEKKVAFEGKTEAGARVFAGEYEADVDAEGRFRIVLILTHDGANKATLKAVDRAGNQATASVTAYYDAPAETEKPNEEAGYDFTARQKYGSCGESPPYDEWSGTGTPGTKVWIGSEFGSGTTTVGDHGEWYLKVTFHESPCNETFKVVLETNTGIRKVYEFTRICETGGDGDK